MSFDFGVDFDVISGNASGAPSEGLWSDLGTILAPFWVHFGNLFGSFFGIPSKSEN